MNEVRSLNLFKWKVVYRYVEDSKCGVLEGMSNESTHLKGGVTKSFVGAA